MEIYFDGHTVLLTTHYLEEAEALCGRIAMLRHGQIVALDTTSALLQRSATNVLRFSLDEPLPPELARRAQVTGRIVQINVRDAVEIEDILSKLRHLGHQVRDVEVRKTDLEDVFLHIMAESPQPLPTQSIGEVL